MLSQINTKPTRNRVCVVCARAFVVPRPSTVQPCCSRTCAAIARTGSVRTAVTRTCERCGKTFRANPSAIARGGGRFCSRGCVSTGRPTLACQGCGVAFTVSPSLVHRQWCSAACRYRTTGWQDVLKPGKRTFRSCGICGAEISGTISHPGRYCSRKCLGVANGRRQLGRDPTKWRTYICVECGTPYVKQASLASRTRYCSRSCRALWRNRRAHMARPTSIEIALRAALQAIGIEATPEYRAGRFLIDLALPDWLVAVEADGDYWHALPNIRAADARKDAYLTGAGWRVVRFTETQINADAAACAAAVAALL